VVDLAAGVLVRSLGGFHEPQGIQAVPDRKVVAVANGQAGNLQIVDGATLQSVRTVPLRRHGTVDARMSRMFRRLGITVCLASVAFALVTGSITHVHPGTDGHGAGVHAHFFGGHPAHPRGGSAVDGDDGHARVSYVNPYVFVAANAGTPVIALTWVAVSLGPPAVPIPLVEKPTERAHGPPRVPPRFLRGPPARPASV
jgi:hypothetical protein